MLNIFWTEEALEAALSQLKASRFAIGMSQKECMRQVLSAAAFTQHYAITGVTPPKDPVDDKGNLIGDWIKGKNDEWVLAPILYD